MINLNASQNDRHTNNENPSVYMENSELPLNLSQFLTLLIF